MTLDDIKQAAKRLRKPTSELVPVTGLPLTHTQALDLVARLHGFRHYREAEQYSRNVVTRPAGSPAMTVFENARAFLQTTGGLFPVEGDIDDIFELPWTPGQVLGLESTSGRGKTTLAAELACQALAKGLPVRIWDSYKEYGLLTQRLGGEYFDDPFSEEFLVAWRSEAPLVVLTPSAMDYDAEISLAALGPVPEGSVFICEELRRLVSFSAMGARAIRTRYKPMFEGRRTSRDRFTLEHLEHNGQWKLVDATGEQFGVFHHRLTKARRAALLHAA